MRMFKALPALLFATILSTALAPQSLAAPAPAPTWDIQSQATPTNFVPGDESGKANYSVFVTNSGGKVTDHSPITITDTLPAGLVLSNVKFFVPRPVNDFGKPPVCETEVTGEVSTVSCEITDAIAPKFEPARFVPGDWMLLRIYVTVPPEAAGTLVNRVEVEGGGAEAVVAEAENQASVEDPPAGFDEFRAELTGVDGKPAGGAASHPYQYTTSFAVNLDEAPPGSSAPFLPAEGDLKEIEVALPPGLIGNPTAVKRCSAQQFTTSRTVFSPARENSFPFNECPIGSAVGVAIVQQLEGGFFLSSIPIHNLVPPKGMPAQFGFVVESGPIYINTRLRSDSDYGITAYLSNVTQAKRVMASRIMIWGTPWDESHDPIRGECALSWELCPVDEGGSPRPFLRLPSSCENPLLTTMSFTTWAQPPTGASATFSQAAPTECDKPPFEPSIEAKPTTNVADAPSGLHFNLHLPQAANDDPEGLAHADLRDAKVTLPEGFVVNPSSADGLAACSLSQIGYTGFEEGRPAFSAEPAECPDASKVGTVHVETPLVDHPLPGAVYLAMPHENPFNNLITIYIAINDPQTGVVVKLAGEVTPDPVTGQLRTTVKQNPQLPFEDFTFDFFEGARAPLRTPATCGTHVTNTEMTPWTAPAGSSAFPSDSFASTTPAAGQGSCPTSASGLPHSPGFEAGTEAPVAGAFSPMAINLRRGDGSQEFGQVTLSPPPGLLARLAGIPYCSEAALAAAASGSGRSEQASSACPSASQVGTVTVGAGAGPAPYYAQGKAYLSGPYKGAPLSLAIVTPAVAGPFDLGAVVVRTALHVDPATTQIRAVSDPIPHILQGIPLDVRSVSVKLDRAGWGLNPTSCEPFSFSGSLLSTLGHSAGLENRFQVGGCQDLGFKPKLTFKLKGKTKRTGFPALRATYAPRAGDANLKSLVLRFPRSAFIEQGHFRTICTRVQWAAGPGGGELCPKGSVYGKIKASTPLLDEPLEGPVYLRSSNNNLPDVVFALRGQVDAEVAVQIDSVKGGLRARIPSAPDVPVSKVVLEMQGGQKGLFVNSRDLCAHTYRANVKLAAQSGKGLTLKPAMRAQCGKQGKRQGGKGRRGNGKGR